MDLQKVGIGLASCPDPIHIFEKHTAHQSQTIPRRKPESDTTHQVFTVPWAAEEHNYGGPRHVSKISKALIQGTCGEA